VHAQPQLPAAAAAALDFMASIKRFGATVPFICFPSLGWNKVGEKIAKVESVQSYKTNVFKA